MTKVVHKNVSQGCININRSESEKIMQPLHNIKVTLKDTLQLKKNLNFHNISIHRIFLSKVVDR